MAEEFDDGWMRGLRISDLEVSSFLHVTNITVVVSEYVVMW